VVLMDILRRPPLGTSVVTDDTMLPVWMTMHTKHAPSFSVCL